MTGLQSSSAALAWKMSSRPTSIGSGAAARVCTRPTSSVATTVGGGDGTDSASSQCGITDPSTQSVAANPSSMYGGASGSSWTAPAAEPAGVGPTVTDSLASPGDCRLH